MEKEKYFSAALFFAYFIKLVLKPIEVMDGPIFLILASVLVFQYFHFQLKQAVELKKQLSDLKVQIEQQNSDLKAVQNYASGIKLGIQKLGRNV